jgi:hypothetical protein
MKDRKNNAVYYREPRIRRYMRFESLMLIPILAVSFIVITETAAKAYSVGSVKKMGQFTGDAIEDSAFSANNVNCDIGTPGTSGYVQGIGTKRHVYGTDLGASYSFTQNGVKTIRFLFGDTFGPDEGDGRDGMGSNVVGYTKDTKASDGIRIDDFVIDSTYKWAKWATGCYNNSCPYLGPYAYAGFAFPAFGGLVEAIWSTEYNDPGWLVYPTIYKNLYSAPKGTRLWSSSDSWQTANPLTSAKMPRDYSNADFAKYFDIVTIFNNTADGYLYFFGKKGDRLGDFKVMRIKYDAGTLWNWLTGANVVPEIRTSTGWTGIDKNPSTVNLSVLDAKGNKATPIGDGSVMWIGSPINRWVMIYGVASASNPEAGWYHTSIQAAFSSNPYGGYTTQSTTLMTGNSCNTGSTYIKDVYAPTLLPDYTTCGTSSCTIYFLISRMSPGYGNYKTCTSYNCAAGTWSPSQCHKVYNTFLMQAVVSK